MLLSIDFESEIPIYQQIKNQIIKGIATGQLSPGESLPSVRQLAADIGVNFHTINKVYTQLKQEGWVVIHRRQGVMINPELSINITQDYIESLESTLEVIAAQAYLRGISKEKFIEIINEKFSKFAKKGSE
ncbi:transcriptional regulator, GntR family [Alkalithermobacter thermoalcaliphilus JW-YL-7 = DSM 7308]|uniref:Transcriptional regulator, GntR family n=1 Tax=Alkalithermobacter thermoalcaliphilus JW-YL-7 = DSM 7308 TaxID=1121328 RepID=A0A150FN60_CLOPD|nr:transcriptional regulator, GntR family [[Clostridium] paradoxum JW-YL-7 = DSM 7308]SHL04777.1 transcriptional regulator, GntR family [[Clostridium] paradoxum JW-YL-7 = DSM 7308]